MLSIHNSSGDARLYSAVYSVASAFQDFLDKSKSSNLIISEPKSGCDKVKEAIGNILKKSDLSGGSNKNDSVNSKTNKKKNNSNSDGGFP